MSIVDDVTELRARLAEIEAEKAASISRPILILNEVGDIGRLETLTSESADHTNAMLSNAITYGQGVSLGGSVIHNEDMYPDPILPLITPLDPLPRYLAEAVIHPTFRDTLQYKCETLKTQIRLYTRLRAECMQALREATERLAMLKDENAAL